jgi:hypothetical protein
MSESLRISRSAPSISTSVPAIFRTPHAVADFDVQRNNLPRLVSPARADGQYLGFDGLFVRGIRNDHAACGFFFRLYPLDHHPVAHWPETRHYASLEEVARSKDSGWPRQSR